MTNIKKMKMKKMKILFLGDNDVGKTSLIDVFLVWI